MKDCTPSGLRFPFPPSCSFVPLRGANRILCPGSWFGLRESAWLFIGRIGPMGRIGQHPPQLSGFQHFSISAFQLFSFSCLSSRPLRQAQGLRLPPSFMSFMVHLPSFSCFSCLSWFPFRPSRSSYKRTWAKRVRPHAIPLANVHPVPRATQRTGKTCKSGSVSVGSSLSGSVESNRRHPDRFRKKMRSGRFVLLRPGIFDGPQAPKVAGRFAPGSGKIVLLALLSSTR